MSTSEAPVGLRIYRGFLHAQSAQSLQDPSDAHSVNGLMPLRQQSGPHASDMTTQFGGRVGVSEMHAY